MQVQNTYPELYLSDDIKGLLTSLPPMPLAPEEPIEPPVPVDPGEYDNGGNRGCSLFFLIGAIIGLVVAFAQDDINWGVVLPLIALIGLLFFMFKTTTWDKESHIKKKEEYKNAVANYPRLLAEYEREKARYLEAKRKYDSTISAILSECSLSEYRSELFEEWKSHRSSPVYMDCDASDIVKKGASEDYFASVLANYDVCCYVDKKVPVGSKYYYPDIILVYDNLFFDIEIDEPYAGNDGTPIHYLEDNHGLLSSIDEDRNEYMTKKGFEVIRFSEEQIFLHTDDCLRFIGDVMVSIKHGIVPSTNTSFSVKKLTKEQASKLAYKRFRNTYVPLNYQKYIDQEN